MIPKVAVVDDDQILLDLIVKYLREHTHLEVAWAARDGLAAEKMIDRNEVDVLILDVGLPKKNGLHVAEHVVKHHPNVAVVMLSMFTDNKPVRDAIRAGVKGYIDKTELLSSEIEANVLRVYHGEYWFSERINKSLVEELKKELDGRHRHCCPELTNREVEILTLIADGYSPKEGAFELGIDVKTFETHRRNIMKKLGIQSIALLTKYAISEGLTSAAVELAPTAQS